MGKLAEKHLKTNALQAAGAFAKHVITKRSDGRWLLQQIHRDGKPEWTMAAEVIALEGGGLFVGGDIDHVVFSWGPKDPIARVRWMGECSDLDYYVRQKARIGTPRHPNTVDEWHSSIAEEELKEFLASCEEEEPGFKESDQFDQWEFDLACNADTQHEFLEHANDAFPGYGDLWESIGDMGEVLSPAVIYAHAALARLCVLIREEEAAAVQATGAL